MPKHKLVDHYEHGDVALLVYELENGERRWWVRAGVGMIEFNKETMTQFVEIMKYFIEEGEV